MAPNPLASTVADHGSLAITLDDFAAITATTPAALRGRRDRDSTFPAPINPDASPLTYFLRDLTGWWADPDRDEQLEIDQGALSRWRFTASFEQCSAAHGAQATRRLVAGVALLLCDQWPLETRIPELELLVRLRAHAATVEPRFQNVRPKAEDFQPDPIPATDRQFLTTLLSWSRRSSTSQSATSVANPQIPDRSPVAARLLRDLHFLHRMKRNPFIEIIDPIVRGLARDISTRPSSSDLGLTRLMVSIVDPQPGEVVVDLACGQGSTFIEAISASQPKQIGKQLIGCIGRERDELVWTIAKVRLGLRGIAHDLGQPSNGLEYELEPTPIYRFITDPGMRIPQLRKWLRRHVDLLGPTAMAALAVPASAVFRPNPGRSWKELQTEIDSVVFTPTDTAVILLRHDAPAWKTLVQIHRMTAAMAERRYRDQQEAIGVVAPAQVPLDAVDPAIEPFMPAQIQRVAKQVGRHAPLRNSDRKPPEGEDDFVQWRPLQAITIEDLGEPRFGDCTAIRDAVPAREEPNAVALLRISNDIAEVTHAGHPIARADGAPIPSRKISQRSQLRGRASFAALREAQRNDGSDEREVPRFIEELTNDALEAVSLLRWLLDPSTLKEKPLFRGRNSPKTNGALEEFGTEEMRRALRRLEQRLLGEETRGRRPKDETE